MTTLLYLYILYVIRVRWFPLHPTCNNVTSEMSGMSVGPATLASIIAPSTAVVVAATSESVLFLPVRLVTPNSLKTLLLLSVGGCLVPRPSVI